jgi:formylglycine-generating enzyme required for sulfatase activity/predicted Ser/Thr protein kinase
MASSIADATAFQKARDDLINRLQAGRPADLTRLSASHPEYRKLLLQVVKNLRELDDAGAIPFARDLKRKALSLKKTRPEFDGYRLEAMLGQGGSAIVYRGYEIGGGRKVAVKVFFSPSARQLLTKEYGSLRDLSKVACVPTMLRCSQEDGLFYLVMELVEGETLQTVMKSTSAIHLRRRLPDLMLAMCEALDDIAHQARSLPGNLGLAHGDLKPSNIIIQDEFARVVILDFGIARLIRPRGAALETGTLFKTIGYTRMYAAPEVLCGEKLTVASDLFQVGAIGYRIATGRDYWKVPAGSRLVLLRQSSIPPRLKSILKKALSWDVERRYQQADEMLEDLRRWRSRQVETARLHKSAPKLKGRAKGPWGALLPPKKNTKPARATKRAMKGFQIDLGLGVDMQTALVPAGTFTMGAPAEQPGFNDDEKEHTVTISRPFYMGCHLVTQGQYERVMKDNPSYFPGSDLPVENVSWTDAAAFCHRLSIKTGKRVRLPTEAEWEYACRAGTCTAFNTGDTISTQQANYDGSYTYNGGPRGISRQKTTPSGSFAPNAWGLYDMHGNLWEWCSDWYGEYDTRSVTDPLGPQEGDIRVLRGGSWFRAPADCRSAQRDGLDPGRRHREYGIRIVTEIP